MGTFAIAKHESSAEQNRCESRSKGKTVVYYVENEIFGWIREALREQQGESWPRKRGNVPNVARKFTCLCRIILGIRTAYGHIVLFVIRFLETLISAVFPFTRIHLIFEN